MLLVRCLLSHLLRSIWLTQSQVSLLYIDEVYSVFSVTIGSSATAVGVTNCVRSIMGAITAIFSSKAIDKAGTGILFTVLAVINVLNIVLIITCSVFGEKWRGQFEHHHGHAMPATALLTTTKTEGAVEQSIATDEEHRVGLHLARITSKHSAL